MTHLLKAIFVFITCLFVSLSTNAALIPVTSGPLTGLAVYDNVLDITWTKDANINGQMDWDTQMAWAAGLTLGGFNDWRLASMDLDLDFAFPAVDCSTASELACRDNEYGYMYYHNGVTMSSPGLFTNIQSLYWSSSEVFIPGSADAWFFGFDSGSNGTFVAKAVPFSAWAVGDGNVGGAVVPVPAAAWLFGSALGLLGWMRRKKV